jgi:hypothetical protein
VHCFRCICGDQLTTIFRLCYVVFYYPIDIGVLAINRDLELVVSKSGNLGSSVR